MFSCVITAMQYKVVMMTHTMTYINWAAWWLSFFGYFFFAYVYGIISNDLWYGVVEFDFPQVSAQYSTYSYAIISCLW